MKFIGEKIKYLRQLRGYSLSSLAQKAGVSKSTLHKIEDNLTNPTINTIWAISKVLEIPFGDLVEKDLKIEEKDSIVSLIEKNDYLEIYKMTLLNQTTILSNPHFPNTKEEVLIVSGEVLVGEVSNPKALKQGEKFIFNADRPHLYKALNNYVVLIVTIKYPKIQEKYFYEDKFINVADDKYIKSIVHEVQNGIDTIRVFSNSNFEIGETYKNVHLINTSKSLYFCSIFNNSLQQINDFLKYNNIKYYNFIVSFNEHNRTNNLFEDLLKSELLLINQTPNVFENNFDNLSTNIQEYNKTDFERRINVDLYGYFEYFHPGYAIQSLLIASFLNNSNPKNNNILDIGSGPGQHLTLINQIINKDITYTCVEPSSKSISFLEKVENVNTIIQNDFLTYEFKNHFEFILSVGSSHHIDLYSLLDTSYNLLDNNGFLIVSDEFISPFTTKYQREKNLILHHTFYMIEAMVNIKDLSKNEQKLYDLLRENIPYIRYLTINNEVMLAKNITISLFNNIKKFDIKKDLYNNLISYYLFMILELEALVAGLDYEEERKTSNEKFIDIANSIGFNIVHNICFHPTSKNSGTYMIVLQKVS